MVGVLMLDDCCSMLEMATSSPDVLACLCLLSQDLGVSEAGLSIGDVIKTYTHCTGLHPHLPAAGCSHVLSNKTSRQQLTHARVEPMQEKRVRPQQFITGYWQGRASSA
ncbi:uncharacterized protein LOC125526496 [Triticum urartu]|uniref:uncharacterized protein LOC125526496 n=1 Tax=Triticum urartu TaxID=4572 RepID=UPI002044ACB9|nr:uncharacterized protein LOC125526496 [Triticum urartu]